MTHFPADDQAVREAVGVARRFARGAGLGDDATARLCIIVEELVTNIVEHGAPPPGSEIAMKLSGHEGEVTLLISDAGLAFDPRWQPQDTIPERGGGAGLALVRSWTSTFAYERTEGRNVVRLTIPISAP